MNKMMIVVSIIAILIYSVIYGFMSKSVTEITKNAVVKVKLYEPSTRSSYQTFNPTTKTMNTHYTGHHERWNISFELEDNTVVKQDNKDLYMQYEVNDKVMITIRKDETNWFGTYETVTKVEKL